jgi:tRNA U34 5-carboxymethylaminomethyl modifying enzyme MnmG/GidA
MQKKYDTIAIVTMVKRLKSSQKENKNWPFAILAPNIKKNMKNLFILLMVVGGNVFANSAVVLSDGTFLQSSDYVGQAGRDKYSNNRHLRKLLGKLLKERSKLMEKCGDRTFNSSELIRVNSDLLKVANLQHPDGTPIVGRVNSKGTIKTITNPDKNCGVDIKGSYQK